MTKRMSSQGGLTLRGDPLHWSAQLSVKAHVETEVQNWAGTVVWSVRWFQPIVRIIEAGRFR